MTKDYSQIASDEAILKAKSSLEVNGFTVEIVENIKDAHDRVIALIPEGSEVFTATSVTSDKAELTEELNNSGKYISIRNKIMPMRGQVDKVIEMKRLGSATDYTVGSVHAVTEDGQVVIASATGSQFPNYVYGANHVIWLVGTQKIVKDLNQALDRIESYAYKLEDARALKAYGIHSNLSKLLIYRTDPHKRVTVIFIKESVGF